MSERRSFNLSDGRPWTGEPEGSPATPAASVDLEAEHQAVIDRLNAERAASVAREAAWEALARDLHETTQHGLSRDGINGIVGGHRSSIEAAVRAELEANAAELAVIVGQQAREAAIAESGGLPYDRDYIERAVAAYAFPAESGGLDVERLKEAMKRARQAVAWTPEAKDIAAEYAALSEPES